MNSLNRIKKFAGIVLLTAFMLYACSPFHNHDMIITNVNIIDVETGKIIKNQTVAIDSNIITAIYENGINVSAKTKTIDGSNKFLIPGLWDMHTHYFWDNEYTNPILIANGITGVREMWGDMKIINQVRKKSKSGEMLAPDIYTSGTLIDGKPPLWPGSVSVSTTEEAIKEVKNQIKTGVDFIKVYSMLTEECFVAIAKVANENNVPFAGHIPYQVSIYKAIDAGMASSEHFLGILEACSSKKDFTEKRGTKEWFQTLIESFNEHKFDSLCAVLSKSNMWFCPTLTVNRSLCYIMDTAFKYKERLKFLSDEIKKTWDPKYDFRFEKIDDELFTVLKKRFHFEQSLIGKMNRKGVKILAGTDYPNPYCYPGFSLHDELSLLVDGGMNELEALKAATINPAIFMQKKNEFGSVETGKLANLVLLNKNPLENIENSKTIESVILRGKIYDRTALDKMLSEIKMKVATPLYSQFIKSRTKTLSLKKALDSLDILIASESDMYTLRESDINMLGYEYLFGGNISDAIMIFKKNIELFPESYNAYDSYAEALMKGGELQSAIENFQKSFELNSNNTNASQMIDSIKKISANKKP